MNRLPIAFVALFAAVAATPSTADDFRAPTRAERWRDGKPVVIQGVPSGIDRLNRRDFPVTLDGDVPPQHVDHDETHAALGSDYLNFLYGRSPRSPGLPGDRSYVGPVGNGHLGRRATTEGRSPRSGLYRAAPDALRADFDAARAEEMERRARLSGRPRAEIVYTGLEKPGTIVIDSTKRTLTLVEPNRRAIRYSVGVGRQGYGWKGIETVSAKREWPEWRPPADMLARRPDLPTHMVGGPDNPLGARAIYLGSTLYRIHGSNEPETIGERASSGCIRMTNDDVIDLYSRVSLGARVVVL